VKSLLLFLILATGLSCGCTFRTASPVRTGGACYGKSFSQLLEITDLKDVFRGIAKGLCSEPCGDCIAPTSPQTSCKGFAEEQLKTILVTDFVDLQSFVPNSQGLLMGELMRASLNNDCCYKIVQAEFGKFFNLSEKGLVVLTRRIEDIKTEDYPRPEVIAGTYSYLNNKIVIFARKINTTTGGISRMITREIDYSCQGMEINYTVK